MTILFNFNNTYLWFATIDHKTLTIATLNKFCTRIGSSSLSLKRNENCKIVKIVKKTVNPFDYFKFLIIDESLTEKSLLSNLPHPTKLLPDSFSQNQSLSKFSI